MRTNTITQKQARTTRRRRGAVATAAALAIALVAAGGVWQAGRAARGDDLMTRATLVVNARTWSRNYEMYRWRNDHEIVRLRSGGEGGFYDPVVLRIIGPKGAISERGVAVGGARLAYSDTTPVSFSPDGNWLLYRDRSWGRTDRYFAVALDGSKRRCEWPGLAYGSGHEFWFTDNHRFITVLFDATKNVRVGRVFSLDAPGVSKPFRLPGKGRRGTFAIAALPAGRFLGKNGAPDGNTLGEAALEPFTEFGTGAASRPPRNFVVPALVTPVPAFRGGATVNRSRDALVSPQGDRVLWIVSTYAYPAPDGGGGALEKRARAALVRFFPRALAPPPFLIYDYDLAIARLDGRGGLTRPGAVTLPERTNANGYKSGSITDWQWTPDGCRISFTHEGALYTVPVAGM